MQLLAQLSLEHSPPSAPISQIQPSTIKGGIGHESEPGMRAESPKAASKVADDMVGIVLNDHGRIEQKIEARGVTVHSTLVGHYCTSLDMMGAPMLDDELTARLDNSCHGFTMSR